MDQIVSCGWERQTDQEGKLEEEWIASYLMSGGRKDLLENLEEVSRDEHARALLYA